MSCTCTIEHIYGPCSGQCTSHRFILLITPSILKTFNSCYETFNKILSNLLSIMNKDNQIIDFLYNRLKPREKITYKDDVHTYCRAFKVFEVIGTGNLLSLLTKNFAAITKIGFVSQQNAFKQIQAFRNERRHQISN